MAKTKKLKETKAVYAVRITRGNGVSPRKRRPAVKAKLAPKRALGKYIVADPEIWRGKPTFTGTRIMVWQVLEMVANDQSWDKISERWDGQISHEAIAEAVLLASQPFKHAYTAIDIHDMKIINRHAKRLNKEAQDVLAYQVIP